MWVLEYQHESEGSDWERSVNDVDLGNFVEKLRYLYLLIFTDTEDGSANGPYGSPSGKYRLRNAVTGMTLNYRSIYGVTGHDPVRASMIRRGQRS